MTVVIGHRFEQVESEHRTLTPEPIKAADPSDARLEFRRMVGRSAEWAIVKPRLDPTR